MTDENVVAFPGEARRTPAQTLSKALEMAQAGGLCDVLVAGYEPTGNFVILSSDMTNKDALWMIEMLREQVLSLTRES